MKNSLTYCQWTADRRFGKIVLITVLLLVTLVLSFTPPVAAGGRHSVLPPSHRFGKTLDKWMLLYWTSVLSGEQDGQVRNVRFLPMPTLEPTGEPNFFVGERDVTLPPGTAFVTPVLAFIGETFVRRECRTTYRRTCQRRSSRMRPSVSLWMAKP